MLPLNVLPRNAGTPAALLVLDGLGVCYFNDADPRNKFWEVAFLRSSDHFLKITVGGDVYNISPDAKTIDFKINNGSSQHYDTFTKGYLEAEAEFSRACGNRYDFRWVINFAGDEVPHGAFKGLKTRAMNRDRVGVTLARIPHSLFYTHTPTEDFVILSPRELDDPGHGLILGPTNEIVGAVLVAETPAGLTIVVGDGSGGACDPASETVDNCVIELPQPGDGILELSVGNMDELKREIYQDKAGLRAHAAPARHQKIPKHKKVRNYLEGDFSRYYEVIEVDGDELTLWAARKHPKQHNRLGDCNLVRLETDDVNSLAELID